MKNLTLLGLLSLTLAGCSEKIIPENSLTGKLKLEIGISVIEKEIGSTLKSGVSTDSFRVQIFNSKDQVVKDFKYAKDIPNPLELKEGQYYAIASSENNKPAAFENPYYLGNSGNFTIVAGETTTESIECNLANIKITVVYSSKVISSFSDYTTTISNSSANLVFAKDETRVGFFSTGPLQIVTDLKYTVGSETKTKIINGEISGPQAGRHYEVSIDASQKDGGSVFNITIDNTIPKEVVTVSDSFPVLISEVMYDPSKMSDSYGEWIEIYNYSAGTVNLKGLVLRRSTSFHKIASDVNVPAHGFVVLGNTDTATNNVSYVYSSLSLSNTNGEIILSSYGTNGLDGTPICSVKYEQTGYPSSDAGKSIQLDPTVNDPESALLVTNWCQATLQYSTGDYGTPGVANTACF